MMEMAWSMPPDSVPTYFSQLAVKVASSCTAYTALCFTTRALRLASLIGRMHMQADVLSGGGLAKLWGHLERK